MLIDDMVKKLSADMELADALHQTEMGAYWLRLAMDVTVEMVPTDEGFYLRAEVGELPSEADEAVKDLMLANLLGQGTGGATLSLDGKEKKIFLNRAFYWEMPYVEFKDYLEGFLNYVEYWKKRVAEWQS